MDRLVLLPDPPYTEILRTVQIHNLSIRVKNPDGTLDTYVFYPPEGEPQDWDDYRWDTVVYPMEFSLIFYCGWQFLPDEGYSPGSYGFFYEIGFEFLGETYIKRLDFRVQVLEGPP